MRALVFNMENEDTMVMRSANANRTAKDLIFAIGGRWMCVVAERRPQLLLSLWEGFLDELNTEVQTNRIDRF